MNFKQFIAEAVLQINVGKLYGWRPKVEEVIKNIKEGRVSQSVGEPVVVSKLDSRGDYFIINGYHRVIEAIMRKENIIIATVDEFTPNIERTGGAHAGFLADKVKIVDLLQNNNQ